MEFGVRYLLEIRPKIAPDKMAVSKDIFRNRPEAIAAAKLLYRGHALYNNVAYYFLYTLYLCGEAVTVDKKVEQLQFN